MKNFTDICKMTQMELKKYLARFLKSYKYTVVNEDGFLYAKGTEPVLLVAHMDTVHKEIPSKIIKEKTDEGTKVSSPQGIGGDDRCGIFTIMSVIKQGKRPSVLFNEDEEIGCVGARKFTETEHIKSLDVNFMVEIDRRGVSDCVFYSNANKEFQTFVEDTTGYKKAYGSCSDISKLMPASGIAGVNLSSGYFNEHTKDEYVILEAMQDTINAVISLIEAKAEKYEYVRETSSWGSWGNYGGYSQKNLFDYGSYTYGNTPSKPMQKKKNFIDDYNITLYVTFENEYGDEEEAFISGATKPECWMNFFMENEEISFSKVLDYSYE